MVASCIQAMGLPVLSYRDDPIHLLSMGSIRGRREAALAAARAPALPSSAPAKQVRPRRRLLSGLPGRAGKLYRARSRGCIEAKFCKYAFESARRDLHNALLCTGLKSHFFNNLLEFCQNLRNFSEILLILLIFAKFCKKFGKILTKKMRLQNCAKECIV